MISECEILTNIQMLDGLDLIDPRYLYYVNKINEDLDIALKGNLISTEKCAELRSSLHYMQRSINLVNTSRVFKEFGLWEENPREFLEIVKLRDILYCKKLCENLNFFDSEEKVIATSSVKFVSSCMETIANFCKENIKTKPESRLYVNLIMLRKIIMKSFLIPQLHDRAIELAKELTDWRLELLERDKEFYSRRTPLNVSNLAKSSQFSESLDELIKSHKNYIEYYNEYYAIKIFYYFYVDALNFNEHFEQLKDSVKSLELPNDQKDVIYSYLVGARDSCAFKNEEPYIIITNSVYDNVAHYGCYEYSDLVEAVNLARDFIDTFSKVKLVRYCLERAKMELISENGSYMPDEVHDMCLYRHLELLEENGVITEKEKNIVFEDRRRSKYEIY